MRERVYETHKKENKYDLSGKYGIGYTYKGDEFYFDLDDYTLIKEYCWCIDHEGYVSTNLWDDDKKKSIRMHRLIISVSDKKDEISQKCAGFIKQRLEKGHFKFPSAGSVFKNNHEFGEPAGKIIDSLGLKGYSIGGAQISPWHGNIIINRNKATQSDVLALVNFVREKVFAEKGFYLESEIIFCGKDASTSFV